MYLIKLDKYFTPEPYLMDTISCEKFRLKYLEGKYYNYCTVFDKYFMPGPYLMDPISCDIFLRHVLNI